MFPLYMNIEKSREKALRELVDSPINKHVLDIINDGVTIIPADVEYILECENAVKQFYKFKSSNLEVVKKHEDSNGYLHRVVNLHEKIEQLALLFSRNSKALNVLDYFFDEKAVIYTSLFFERGSEQGIHRDTPYFCTVPEYSYFGFWIALEDTDSDNGSLRVVKGAHTLPELDRIAIAKMFYDDLDGIDPYDTRLWMEYHRQLKEQYSNAGLEEEELHFKKGDAVLWHPQAPHGAVKILDINRTRLSFVMHATPQNTPVYKQDVFFTNKVVSDKTSWNYKDIEDRKFISHGRVSFAHVEAIKLTDLND